MLIRGNLRKARQLHWKKREGGFLRLLGEIQTRRGESDNAISNLNASIDILKDVN